VDGSARLRRSTVALAAAAGLLVALGAAGCKPCAGRPRAARLEAPPATLGASDPPPAQPPPGTFTGADTIEDSIDGGWITLSVTLPHRPAGRKPVVISPIVPERDLLDRGIGFVRFRTHWELLRPLAEASRAKSTGGAPATGPGDPGRALASGTGAPSEATGVADPGAIAGAAPANSVGAWLLAAPRPGLVGRAYFQLVTQDAQASIPRVIDYLSRMPGVDPERIAIGGSSTSGFVALQALAAEPRIAAAVVRVACGDYLAFLRSSRLALNDDPRWVGDGPLPLDPDYLAEIRRIEPIGKAAKFPPRPLLLMVGEVDPAIPFACAERTAEVFRAAYRKAGRPERFRFDVFEREGHNLGDESRTRALDWWSRWLLDPPRPVRRRPRLRSTSRGA
jgi:hypothetical protein